MTYRKPAHLLIACAAIFLLASTLSCGIADRHPERDGVVWFVQVTDPHLFLDTSKDADAAKKSVREKQEKLDQSAMSDLWKQLPSLPHEDRPLSFLVMTGDFGIEPCSIADISAPATSPVQPKAEDCLEKVNKGKRDSQITALAGLLGGSPVRDIYLIPGNNDIPYETAADAGLAYFNQFVDEVQKKIDDSKKNVQLHNLSRCYLSNGDASTCYTDIAGTPYRLVGFPSYSFKNREPGFESNTPLQEKQFEIFRRLLDQARQSGKKVLILTHTPLIDDPYTLAQDRYAGISPPAAVDKDANNSRSVWSVWNVSKKLADEWQEAVALDSVVGILAGHLHDSHKEIYERPFSWSTVNDPKNGFGKLYLAPPVSVKNQDTSPIQARGLALVGLEPDGIKYHLYWYNAERGDFTPDRPYEYVKVKSRRRDSTWATMIGGVERINRSVWQFLCPTSLDQVAILFIALLAAYLTVVQIWRIPAPENPLTGQSRSSIAQGSPGGAQSGTSQAGGVQSAGTQDTATKPAFDPSPFASNLGKTVLAGLGGLAAETVLKSLEGKPAADDKEFYIVWFIVLFFLVLFVLAFLRAFGEALRERLLIIHLKSEPRPFKIETKPGGFWRVPEYLVRFFGWLLYWCWYWLTRFAKWLLSLRSWLLTFVDTFTSLIQGKNQTQTKAFSDSIIKQQRNVIHVAQVVRQQLNDLILQRLNTMTQEGNQKKIEEEKKQPEDDKKKKKNDWLGPRDVRVNISVLSADQSRVFYIARTPGSALKAFTTRSVAWVSVFTGKIRWYMHDYLWNGHDRSDKEIVLFNNSDGIIPNGEPNVMLSSNYQQREDDYEAFIIFPVPWPQRAFGGGYVKGAIHISFRWQDDFRRIWEFPTIKDAEREQLIRSRWEESKGRTDEEKERFKEKLLDGKLDPNDRVLLSGAYESESEEGMLGKWCDDEVRVCLRQALATVGQLLYGFNENVHLSSQHAGDDLGS